MKKKIVFLLSISILLSAFSFNLYANDYDLSAYDIKWLNKPYEKVTPFINGYARVTLNGKMGLIDKNGTEVIKPIYGFLQNPDKDGHFIALTGNVTIPICMSRAGDKQLMLDINGNVLKEFEADDAMCSVYYEDMRKEFDNLSDKLYYDGLPIEEAFIYSIISDFDSDYDEIIGSYRIKSVKEGGYKKYSVFLKDGRRLLPENYQYVYVTFDDLVAVSNEPEPFVYYFDFYNKKGEKVISNLKSYGNTCCYQNDTKYLPFTEYPSVWKDFGDGLYFPYYDNMYKSGDDTYELIYGFNEGFTSQAKKSTGKYGILDREANLMFPYILDVPAYFNDDIATICVDGKYGVLKKPSKYINLNDDVEVEEAKSADSNNSDSDTNDTDVNDSNSGNDSDTDESMVVETYDDMAIYLHDLGLFNGKSDSRFEPALADETTSYEAITLIGRALRWDVDFNAKSSFVDVPSWAVPYTEYARENGITSGVSDARFGSSISGKRMLTWFLAALGEDKTDVWENTEEYAMEYDIDIPTDSYRHDVVYVIYEGIKHPVVGESTPLVDKIKKEKKEEEKYSKELGLPLAFSFSSGAGGWGTGLALNEDLTFTGRFHDINMGDNGPGFPRGTLYACNFEGKFKNVKKVSKYEYRMQIDYIKIKNPKKSGIYDELKILYQESGYPYGLDDANEFAYYLPGKPKSELPEDFIMWGYQVPDKLDRYGLYNISGAQGFYSSLDDN